MQIRELSLMELEEAYLMIKKLRNIAFDEFEDLIYEMRNNYKMLGVFEQSGIVALAGVGIMTTLKHKRHLRVFEFISGDEYKKILSEYVEDFSKMAGCASIIFEDSFDE